ncbi:MAG: HAMP domain-containing protein [Chloroflexi bacterium]|nr:HAMP domain-containing protein [Chloroflexota bacterium]
MRLFPKLLLSFLAVVLIGMIVVSVLANLAAAREVRGFMLGNGMTTETALAQRLAGYYRGHGSWEGVEGLLDAPGHGMGGMMRQRVIILDAHNYVVTDTDGLLTGQTLTEYDASSALLIELNGEPVGVLIAEGGMGEMMGGGPPLGPSGADIFARVNRAIWLAALAAGAAALVVGGVIAFSLVRPIQRLTVATRAVARGDLAHRVPVSSADEIGELAKSFNAMAADLEKAERLRRDMTADIAHELRNPLAVLQSNIEAVIDGVLPPTSDNLEPLLDQTRLLSRIVDDLRTLALADAGQLSLDRVPTDPAALARSVVVRFTPQADAKRLTLTADIPDGLPSVNIDSQRIEQVLGNLLSNAIRHTPEGGVVSLQMSVARKTLTTDYSLLTTVSDTGPGIPPNSLPHIFERFYRADKSRTRPPDGDGSGSGLGLAIARQLIILHGGEITAKSEQGNGAQVSFTLPIA